MQQENTTDPLDNGPFAIQDAIQTLIDEGATARSISRLIGRLHIHRASNPDVDTDALDILAGWVSPHLQVRHDNEESQ